jgi:hypothetical protein
VLLTNRSSEAAGVLRLASTAAYGSATLEFSLPAGASLSPSDLTPVVMLGGRGTVTNYSFTFTTESGLASPSYTVSFIVPVTPDPFVFFSHPTTIYTLGSPAPLQLQVQVSSAVTTAERAALRYSYSMISKRDLLLDLIATPIVVSNATILITIDSSLLVAPLEYIFSVYVVDTLASHMSVDGVQPSAAATANVEIQAALVLAVVVEQDRDPCAGVTFCGEGGSCHADADPSTANLSANARSYSLSCVCSTAPVAYHGVICTFAVMDCPSCVSRFIDDTPINLYGLQLDTLYKMRIAGRDVPFSEAMFVNTSDPEAIGVLDRHGWNHAHTMQIVSFLSPALVTVNHSLSASSTSLSHLSRWLLADDATAASTPTLSNPISSYELLTLLFPA